MMVLTAIVVSSPSSSVLISSATFTEPIVVETWAADGVAELSNALDEVLVAKTVELTKDWLCWRLQVVSICSICFLSFKIVHLQGKAFVGQRPRGCSVGEGCQQRDRREKH